MIKISCRVTQTTYYINIYSSHTMQTLYISRVKHDTLSSKTTFAHMDSKPTPSPMVGSLSRVRW